MSQYTLTKHFRSEKPLGFDYHPKPRVTWREGELGVWSLAHIVRPLGGGYTFCGEEVSPDAEVAPDGLTKCDACTDGAYARKPKEK